MNIFGKRSRDDFQKVESGESESEKDSESEEDALEKIKAQKKAKSAGDKYNRLDDVLPKGAPGRSSFIAFPGTQKHFWRDEAVSLRRCFIVLLPLHLGLIFSDVVVYNIEVMAIVMDTLLTWLCYLNFMTLNKITIGMQMVVYLITILMALSHIKRVLLDVPAWLPIIFYFVQYFFFYPLAIAMISKKLKAHYLQQKAFKVKKKRKKLKGRIQLTIQRKSKPLISRIVLKKANYLLHDPSDDEENTYRIDQAKQVLLDQVQGTKKQLPEDSDSSYDEEKLNKKIKIKGNEIKELEKVLRGRNLSKDDRALIKSLIKEQRSEFAQLQII